MKEITPNYYSKFSCIADKCKHNCCIGWEIDIDDKTLAFYNSLNTSLGEKIRNNIEGEEPHFVLCENDRCPFLNSNNLCDIITEHGDEGLCDICKLHPRFCNYYDDFVETGLGLCCEEAARIILTQTEKFSVELTEDIKLTEQENEHFEIRNVIFGVLQDRSKSIKKRYVTLSEMFGFKFEYSLEELCNMYLSFERLDEAWTDELRNLMHFDFDGSIFDDDKLSIPFEQLSVYFIFRHLADALEYADYSERVQFALVSCYIIGALWEYHKHELTEEKMADIARMYSSEIEYSEDNADALLCCFGNSI